MSQVLRPRDALGRMGGDEFAVLLPGAGAGQAGEIAERLCFALSMRVSASAGIASTESDGATAEDLHQIADRRLYSHKRTPMDPRPVRAPSA
jgi:diguanylate cyclase (GGDEF)-like protein